MIKLLIDLDTIQGLIECLINSNTLVRSIKVDMIKKGSIEHEIVSLAATFTSRH
jgi:hypothetical protein